MLTVPSSGLVTARAMWAAPTPTAAGLFQFNRARAVGWLPAGKDCDGRTVPLGWRRRTVTLPSAGLAVIRSFCGTPSSVTPKPKSAWVATTEVGPLPIGKFRAGGRSSPGRAFR